MTQQNLPAYLQVYQAPDVGAALSANLGAAMPPHVSIGGGRFTLIDASNNEIMVPTFDPGDPQTGRVGVGQYLDAAIIDVNPVMSRIYFGGAYDPQAEGVRPDCFSDNGVGPSTQASSPQASTCAVCPRAEWTKINFNGKKVPWCAQKQKVALLIPGFPTLFLLAVPPNSHSYLREYVEKCKGNGANVANLITRISFVPGVQGTLQFQPVSWIDQAVAELRQAAYVEKKTDMLVGRNDVARPAGAIAPPVQQVQIAPVVHSQVAGMGDLNLLHTQIQPTQQWPVQAQQPAQQWPQPVQGTQLQMPVQWPDPRLQASGPPQQFTQQVQQPGPFVPTPASDAGSPGWLQQNAAPTAATTSPSEQPAPGKRRRRTAAEMVAANGAAPIGQQAQQPASAPQAPFPHPGQQAQAQFPQSTQAGALPGQTDMGFGIAQGQPAAANPELAGMLDDFFKQG